MYGADTGAQTWLTLGQSKKMKKGSCDSSAVAVNPPSPAALRRHTVARTERIAALRGGKRWEARVRKSEALTGGRAERLGRTGLVFVSTLFDIVGI